MVDITPEYIADMYSRIPALQPPSEILIIKNGEIGAERLYNAAHARNVAAMDAFQHGRENYHIYGMTRMGSPQIVVAGDALPDTPVHEAVHFNGVRDEGSTRAITTVLMARAKRNLGLWRQPVHYERVPASPTEANRILADMGITNPSGQPINLVHLVYVPP